jgi:inner membrane protein
LDNLTHSLFGLTLARTPLRRAGRGTTGVLLIASNIPDIDAVTLAGGTASYLQWHRGPTHGPLGIVALGFVGALAVSLAGRWWTGQARDPLHLAKLWLVSTFGVLCHVLMDLPTPYGTRALSPFSWTWFSTDWMPIIDVYLWAMLAGGLVLAGRRSTGDTRRRSRFAAIAIVAMLGNYGVRAIAHHTAIVRAPEVFGTTLPERCGAAAASASGIYSWPHHLASPTQPSSERCLIDLAAVPDSVSPFRWRLIAQLSDGYELRDLDLLAGFSADGPDVQLGAEARVPNSWTPQVLQAARSPIAQVFLGFSRFPAARSSLAPDGATTTVRWADVRFTSGSPEQRPRGRGLFGATVRVAADGSILEEHLGPYISSDTSHKW